MPCAGMPSVFWSCRQPFRAAVRGRFCLRLPRVAVNLAAPAALPRLFCFKLFSGEYMDIDSLFARLEKEGRVFTGRSGPATSACLAVEAVRRGRHAALAARSREELLSLRSLVELFTPELSVGKGSSRRESGAPVWERPWLLLPSLNERSLDRSGWAERMAVLYALRHQMPQGLLFTADNMALRLPPLDYLDTRELTLRRGDEMPPELIAEQLAEWGYERVPLVGRPGDMARRGDIFDVLAPGYERPVRIEFYGDAVEEIRVFDFATQRSAAFLDELVLLPVSPLCMGKEERRAAERHRRELAGRGALAELDRASVEQALEHGDPRLLPGAAHAHPSVLEQWLWKDVEFFLPGRAELYEEMDANEASWRDFLKRQAAETSLSQPAHLVLQGAGDARAAMERHPCLFADPLAVSGGDVVDMPERSFHSYAELFGEKTDDERPWKQLCQALRSRAGERRQLVLAFASERGRAKFLKLAGQEGMNPNLRYDPSGRGMFAVVAPFRQGADLVWLDTLVIGEDMLQAQASQGPRRASDAFRGMTGYDDLQPGDLLVHRDYGIGRFMGLCRMSPGGTGVENDFLLIEYAAETKLYLPVDRLGVVQKYKADGEAPPLDRLGGAVWTASREKARRAAEQTAADLIEMYAWRKVAKGFSYTPVGEMYREFEATFGFEETPDQAKAIREVLEDMDKPVPMDRLVCGDVGFGKTEIAMRAAFRAACDGRQSALLCPTTVLAEQHYQTFRARLAGFPVNVGLLSRFVPPAKQKATLEAAARGQIDILIGTHRMLSGDVRLPSLGLLILDEEQRFGVRHKEKLKQLKKNVDVLTLTATPIPRTLQLSMSGIRELSVLETAPAERKPVATAITGRSAEHLREVIERELGREGQVFFVHNRVQSLPRAAEFVRSLAPGARIGMAHGQMGEKELETTMHRFWRGELDILVCTAIVESGLDFPRANTLIVDQAQMFGLGQLYQLRGRVGRSDRQAYAVFVVNDIDHLSEVARERLRVIVEADYLGAGFQVAMEDLRLRGAGNILGEAQSGHMARVGLDLYLEMLEEAVAKMKGEESRLHIETELNLGIPAHIPETYVEDPRERLKYYKMLSTAADGAARESVERELCDRFGRLPAEVDSFLAVLAFKSLANSLGIGRADVLRDRVRLTWAQGQDRVRPEAIVKLALSHPAEIRLVPPATLEIAAAGEGLSDAQRLRRVSTMLENLAD